MLLLTLPLTIALRTRRLKVSEITKHVKKTHSIEISLTGLIALCHPWNVAIEPTKMISHQY
jgi:hypothetical protein